MNKSFFRFFFTVILTLLSFSPASAVSLYKEAPLSEPGTISGQVTFSGRIPAPLLFRLRDFPNDKYCGKISDGKGNRAVQSVRLGEGEGLKDVIVYLKNIRRGKPFPFDGSQVNAENCQFLVQGGLSDFTGVMVDKTEFRIFNNDSDPSRPETILGIKHNPQSFAMMGTKRSLMFKLVSSTKGRTSRRKVKINKNTDQVLLECDEHNYMHVYFLPVTNPYYAVVDEKGQFSIDEIPPGKYEVWAWHPTLGTSREKIKLLPNEKLTLDFKFDQ